MQRGPLRHGQWSAPVLFLGLAACAADSGGKAATGSGTGQPVDSADTAEEVCGPLPTLDVSGCLQVDETDAEASGRWPDITRRQYDASGREVSRDTRGGEEPDTERVCRTEWSGYGKVTEDCGGVSVYRYTYIYNTDGHLRESRYDSGSDGVFDKVWTHMTDELGQIIEVTVDDDADGVADAAQTFAWDGDGHMVEETWDYTYDGVIDYRRTLTWSGELLVSDAEDTDGDGVVDRELVTEYDELDRPEVAYLYKDGGTTATETTRWTYVSCLLDTHTVTDAGGNRTELTYTHDDMGRPTLVVEDWEGDGTPDRVWATEWICPGEAR